MLLQDLYVSFQCLHRAKLPISHQSVCRIRASEQGLITGIKWFRCLARRCRGHLDIIDDGYPYVEVNVLTGCVK